MSVSEEVRDVTDQIVCNVFRCDAGCGNEIICRTYAGKGVRRAVDEWSDSTGWFEVASTPHELGPIFCSWACIATYAAKAAERDTAELIAA